MKDVFFTIHMYGSAQVENESELRNLEFKIEFTKVNADVRAFDLEVNAVADADEEGNTHPHKLQTPRGLHLN